MMSQQRRRLKVRRKNVALDQLDLLGGLHPTVPPLHPIHGLAVRLPDRCSCGSREAIIGGGKGRLGASLFCSRCESHRGLLPVQVHTFLTRSSTCLDAPPHPPKFDVPSEPSRIRTPIPNARRPLRPA